MNRWRVERVYRSLWIAYRHDLEGAMIFRTHRSAIRYASAGGVL